MSEPSVLLFLGVVGSVAGVFSARLRASGLIAVILPFLPALALGSAMGRS